MGHPSTQRHGINMGTPTHAAAILKDHAIPVSVAVIDNRTLPDTSVWAEARLQHHSFLVRTP